MPVRIKAAPPIRRARPRKPRIVVRSESEAVGSSFGIVVLAMLLMAGIVGAALALREPSPDRHYLAAQRMLENYEKGRAPSERNYDNPVYPAALAELDQVLPSSPSADDAATLAVSIRTAIDEFHELQKRLAAQLAATSDRKRRITERIYLAQERARLNPVTSYPECELEGKHTHTHSDSAAHSH